MDGVRDVALYLPPDFTAALQGAIGATRAPTATVRLIADPATPSQVIAPIQGTVQGLIERATLTAAAPQGLDYLFSQVASETPPDRQAQIRAEVAVIIAGGAALGGGQPAVTIERTAPSGMPVRSSPTPFSRTSPAIPSTAFSGSSACWPARCSSRSAKAPSAACWRRPWGGA